MEHKIILIGRSSKPALTIDEFLEKKYVGPGWNDLLKELCEKLFEAGWNGHLLDWKEKFGTLRFHIGQDQDQSNKELYNIIHEYERRSAEFCERCGGFPAHIRNHRSWIKTFCDDCYNKDYAANSAQYKDE